MPNWSLVDHFDRLDAWTDKKIQNVKEKEGKPRKTIAAVDRRETDKRAKAVRSNSSKSQVERVTKHRPIIDTEAQDRREKKIDTQRQSRSNLHPDDGLTKHRPAKAVDSWLSENRRSKEKSDELTETARKGIYVLEKAKVGHSSAKVQTTLLKESKKAGREIFEPREIVDETRDSGVALVEECLYDVKHDTKEQSHHEDEDGMGQEEEEEEDEGEGEEDDNDDDGKQQQQQQQQEEEDHLVEVQEDGEGAKQPNIPTNMIQSMIESFEGFTPEQKVDILKVKVNYDLSAMTRLGRDRAKLTETAYYRVQPRPFFVSDGQGGMMNDTATSLAQARFEHLAAGGDGSLSPLPYEVRRTEAAIQMDRQLNLYQYAIDNRLNQKSIMYVSKTSEGKETIMGLPLINSSPMRCYTQFNPSYKREEVLQQRETQVESLEEAVTFLPIGFDAAYSSMDQAIWKRAAQITRLVQIKKEAKAKIPKWKRWMVGKVRLSKAEWMECDKGLQACLSDINDTFRTLGMPLRVVFRTTLMGNKQYESDFWFVFANTIDEANRGYRSWEGVEHVTSLRDLY